MLTFMLTCLTCTSDVTSLGWGLGMLTFMLTCVTCTSDVTSLGWGGGDANVHVNLRHMHIDVTSSDVTSLGWGGGDVNVHVNQTPFGAHWSRLEEPYGDVRWKKNTAHLFRNKFPVNYRSSKNHFKFPGNFKPMLGKQSVVSLRRKRHFFKTLKTLARFSPRRDV